MTTNFGDIRQGFVYERAPRVTLKSIANNAEIDVIWERFKAKLEPLRSELNAALGQIWRSGKFRGKLRRLAGARQGCTRPHGGRCGSPGSGRSTPRSPGLPTLRCSTTDPTPMRRKSG